MSLETCKCCGQTLPAEPNPLRASNLTSQQFLIADRIRRAGEHGISTDMLIDYMYRGTVNGGVNCPYNVLHVQKRFMRPKLAALGLRITTERHGRSRSVYRLESL